MLLLIMLLATAAVACGGGQENGNTGNIYYLSIQSEGWKTYTSEEEVPQGYLFRRNEENQNEYLLDIALSAGEQFTVNALGSTEKIGHDKLFSAGNALLKGEENNLQTAYAATFRLRYDAENDSLMYTYTADPVDVAIETSVTAFYVGDSYPFAAIVHFSDGTTESKVTWSSDNTSVAAVSEAGVISALSVGKANIKAEAYGLSDTLEITVDRNVIGVESVTLDHTELNLELGEETKLNATVLPADATSKGVIFVSDQEEVVTVSSDGTVKAVGYGSATITVTTNNGGCTDECKVTVIRHANNILLSASTMKLVAEGVGKPLTVSFAPDNATNRTYTYKVLYGEDKIRIEDDYNGTLTIFGLTHGTACVEVASGEDPAMKAKCDISISGKDTKAVYLPETIPLTIGETYTLTVGLENISAEEVSSVSWSGVNISLCSISKSGADTFSANIKANDFGTGEIHVNVHLTNNSTYTASCEFQITDDYFFIFGYGIGAENWDYLDYISDRDAAERAGILFEQSGKGIYTLTRYLTPANGFQIIFPKVTSFIDASETWTKNIPSEVTDAKTYYTTKGSDDKYVSNGTTTFGVNTPGIYTITLDLTSYHALYHYQGGAKVSIKQVALDTQGISLSLKDGAAILREGEAATLNFAFKPSDAAVDEKDFLVTLESAFEDFEDYIKYELDFAAKTIKVTALKDPATELRLSLVCKVGDAEGAFEIIVLPKNTDEAPVTSIAFTQAHYYVNVNNGKGDWTTTVEAMVNDSATIKQVTYSAVLENAAIRTHSVDPDTGFVTGYRLGTYIIKATAGGDPTVTATTKVTFYSDILYLTGEFNDNDAYDAYAQNITSLDVKYKPYTFVMDASKTHFTLEVELEAAKTINGREQYGFQIAHLGMNANWDSLIYDCINLADSYGYSDNFTTSDGAKRSWKAKVSGTYIIEVDLSDGRPSVSINKKDTPLGGISLRAETTTMKKDGQITVTLLPSPSFASIEGAITWSTDTAGYISYSYEESSHMLTVTADKCEHAEDVELVLKCQADGMEASITLTILAEHHFEKKWDTEFHWDQCVDKGCDYIENKVAHSTQSTLTSTDPHGHYYACDGCGYESGFEEHIVPLNSYGWFDFTEAACKTCGFKFFEIADGKLTRFDAKAAKVQIPGNVTEIGENVFAGHSEMTSISLPSNLKTIKTGAFKDCSSLLSVMLPNSLTTIGKSAFSGVSAKILWGSSPTINRLEGFDGYLGKSFTIPASVTLIPGYAFQGSALTSIVVPDTVTSMGMYVFSDCKALQSAEISANLHSFNGGVFEGCTALKTVLFKADWLKSMSQIFKGCTALEAVYFMIDYSTIPHLGIDCVGDNGNADSQINFLAGRCYAYAEEKPADWTWRDKASYEKYKLIFAGTWHWDESGKQELKNIQIWEMDETTATSASMPVILDDKKNLYA